MNRDIIITIKGKPGAGKSTIIALIKDTLECRGYVVDRLPVKNTSKEQIHVRREGP